jgi:2-polyprenyl-6-methoxyphenol hydroxylase-like FAD-dependent oxidoreductase
MEVPVSLVTAPVERTTHVVVIGAGMGGLAAAHALSGYADRVTIVERDDLPTRPTTRSGTPQGRHVHILQPGGQAALERLLPGFSDALVAEGAIPVPAPGGILWQSPAGWVEPQRPGGRPVLSASRALIEWVTRSTVLSRSPIDVRSGVEVTGLAVADDRVVGVDVRPRGAAAGETTERLPADLVVDASGRRSHAPDWLAAAGYDRPAETRIDAKLAYATRTYRRGPDDLGGWHAVVMQAKPPHATRAGVLFPIEGDRWMLTLAGSDGDVPPTDDDGFLAFARGMRSPILADAIERLEPLGPIVGYRRTANQRRHYESLRRAPDGLVVIGDAACAFNPVYGQGMSAAALTAEAIERGVAGHVARSGGDLRGVTAGLQRAVARANAGAWTVAIGQDLRWPGSTGGKESPVDRVMRRYLDRVLAAGTVDPVVSRAFFAVVALLAEPSSLLRPSLAWRVLGHRHPAPPDEPPVPLTAPAPAKAA